MIRKDSDEVFLWHAWHVWHVWHEWHEWHMYMLFALFTPLILLHTHNTFKTENFVCFNIAKLISFKYLKSRHSIAKRSFIAGPVYCSNLGRGELYLQLLHQPTIQPTNNDDTDNFEVGGLWPTGQSSRGSHLLTESAQISDKYPAGWKHVFKKLVLPKGSHLLKNNTVLWKTFIKWWPPPVLYLWNPYSDF